MEVVIVGAQLIVARGILTEWVLRADRPTSV